MLLMTGDTGFIGSNGVAALKDAGPVIAYAGGGGA
jgi:nucleoside-diphosphate-sugar epimerase